MATWTSVQSGDASWFSEEAFADYAEADLSVVADDDTVWEEESENATVWQPGVG